MPYLGKTPSQATRQRYYKTASAGDTSVSGTMTTGGTLTFNDGEFVDVSVNGVALVAGTDYNTSTANTIAGLSALSAGDQVEIVVYDTFSVFSGDVDSNMSVGGNLSVTGTSTLTGAITSSAGATITTDDNAPQLTLKSTDADANKGPVLDLQRDSSSPAADDVIGLVRFRGEDAGSNITNYATISSTLKDPTEGSEDGELSFSVMKAGTDTETLLIDSGGIDITGAFTATSGSTITTADNTVQLTLKSTDADANNGPILDLVRDSGSPADGDEVGVIRFKFDDDAGESNSAARFTAKINDASNGTEDGELEIVTLINGSSRSRIEMLPTETVINEDSQDIDFRVESDENTHAFFLEASTGNVGMAIDAPTLDSSIAGTSVPSGSRYFHMNDAEAAVIKLTDPSSGVNRGAQFAIINTTAFLNNCENGGLILGSGNTGVVTISGSQDTSFFRNGGVVVTVNRGTDDGTLVNFQQASTSEGNISVSGNTVSYNAFSGSHWSRLADNSKPTILRGTVIETIDQMCVWYQAEYTYNGEDKSESIALPAGKSVGDTFTYETTTLDPNEKITVTAKIVEATDVKHSMCKISDTADSKKVYGVFLDWDNDEVDEVNDMYVCAVGTNLVRVHKDVTVEAGDLLSSNGDGTAKVQDDDIIRSKTIGKVTAAIKQETYSDGSYTVPCALYCG
jgi:hypothetical protein